MIISMLSNINSNLLFSSRTLHAMSCDGLFFRRVRVSMLAALPLSRCS